MKIGRRQRKEMAYHEAAHSVAALAQSLSVQFVSLAPVDNHAAGAHIDRAIYLAANDPAAQIAALETDIVVVLAGPAARMKLRPSRPSKRKEWGDNLKLAQAWSTLAAFLASGMSIAELDPDDKIELTDESQAFADQLFDQCAQRARQIVEERWDDIVRVAEALLDRTVLNADDLDALLGNRRDHTLQLLLGRKPSRQSRVSQSLPCERRHHPCATQGSEIA
jgi:ATP-dependent Zn protease